MCDMTKYLIKSVVFVLIITNIKNVYAQSDLKSSLTFVIDSTGSMVDDINAVKKQANAIFDTVVNSNISQVEDFVLVEFNDPEVHFLTRTTNREDFKRHLNSFSVSGGDDCPEMSLTGIQVALEHSRSGSDLYVFTDAYTKDADKYETVKKLAFDKGCRITFFVSQSVCTEPGYFGPIYDDLAEAREGQVFDLDKSEIDMILNYVQENAKSRKTLIESKKFPSGNHKFKYTVDSNMKELIVSVNGYNLKVKMTDYDGELVETKEIVRSSRNLIVKVAETKPGIYTADVHSESAGVIKVYGTNTVHFEHGFSRLPPTAIQETTLRPYPDEKSYLSVKVNVEGGAIKLFSVALYDLKDKLLMEKNLDEINIYDHFYATRESFLPPNESFRIAIKALDLETNAIITRFGLVPIEPQERIKDAYSIETKAPNVSVVGAAEVHVEFEQSAELKCRVSGHPKPQVTWEDENGTKVYSKETQIEIPYVYVSVVEIDNIDKNQTFTCKASNVLGEDKKSIDVRTRRTRFFDVIETPKDKVIGYGKEVQFSCIVDSAPKKAQIVWYRENRRLKTNRNYKISSDGTTLTIRSMTPELDGHFKCIARNNLYKKGFKFTVTTDGIEKPVIQKDNNEIHVKLGSSATIDCKILYGTPRPKIKWYFQPAYSKAKPTRLYGGEQIPIEKISQKNAGTYRCEVTNIAGIDIHYVDLIVEYRPVIRSTKKIVRAAVGEQVRLPCVAFGEPKPEVTWYFNARPIDDKDFHHHGNHILSFTAKTNLTGEYMCEAENSLGVARSDKISVFIFVPVTIDTPERSTYDLAVGQDLKLDCRAHGEPAPRVEWVYHSLDFSVPPQPVTFADSDNSLVFKRIQFDQEGYYTCIARNPGSSANITYSVNILAPPTILNENPDKVFEAVIGDLLLRIPCKTIGSPKPVITWEKDGYNIASGTDWYDIEKDGSLIIKNIDRGAKGLYTCKAENSMGSDMDTYEVVLKDSPRSESEVTYFPVEEGKSVTVPCPVPHKRADMLRWYKDGKQLSSGSLTLKNISTLDEGLYTCRVSNFVKSDTGSISVEVGYKPQFLNNPKTELEYIEGNYVDLDCSVRSKPAAEITWWDARKKLDESSMRISFQMTPLNKGDYYCLVKNQFGSVVREFTIESKECVLDLEKDFGADRPIIVTDKFGRASYENIDGYIHLKQNSTIKLACPSSFEGMDTSEITAVCREGTEFAVNGSNYDLSELKCIEEFEPIIVDTNERCLGDQNIFKIGYEADGDFFEVIELCYDGYKNRPSYAKYKIDPATAGTNFDEEIWYDIGIIPINFDEMYNCENQNKWISSLLNRTFGDSCCFSRRQLVNARDMLPGLPQLATYSNLNVFPHWSTCNEKNWNMVERLIQRLVEESNYPMTVWSGISSTLQLQGASRKEYITITDNVGRDKVRVPKYIWKVIQDPIKRASLAIIQINIPELKQSEVLNHLLCKDICSDVPWMKRNSWRNVMYGAVYCCSIEDFERSFKLHGIFESNMEAVLR